MLVKYTKLLKNSKAAFAFLLILGFVMPSCRVHHIRNFREPCVEIPCEYLGEKPGEGMLSEWWREFNQLGLNRAVKEALEYNLDIRQAWSRLYQARWNICIVASEKWPEINFRQRTEYEYRRDKPSMVIDNSLFYFFTPSLDYEVDLWKKIDSNVKSAKLQAAVALEDLEATALVISGAVTDLWFIIQEQKALIDTISHQIEVSQTLLDLVELRFAIGQSSALDVYQQRLQTENVKSQLIPVEATLKTASHQLFVLLGKAPDEFIDVEPGINNIKLPEFPDIGQPAELLMRRPDLRSQYKNLLSSDYDVAAAVADLYPRITLPTSYEVRTTKLSDFFQREILRIAEEIFQPIFDAGRRCCEVKRREAIVKENLDNFGLTFLNAVAEVEDAIVNEKAELDLIREIELQVSLAGTNLALARDRYAAGLNDYLTVITAIQALQDLERSLISEQRALLANRALLYRALGSPCLLRCRERPCDDPCIEYTDFKTSLIGVSGE